MQRWRTLAGVALLAVSFPRVAWSQGDLPQYTDQQRWQRTATLSLSSMASLVALGKSRGMTIEEIGTWLGNFYRDGWTGGLDARQLAVSFRRNNLSHPAGKVEMVTYTDSLVVARYFDPNLAQIGPDDDYYGMSRGEYLQINRLVDRIIADWVGVSLEERQDGDWTVATMRNKYEAPRASTNLRWRRSAVLATDFLLSSVHAAKAAGKTPAQAGQADATLWKSTWSGVDTPWRLFRGMTWNNMLDPNLVCTVQSATATQVKARCNRPWLGTVRNLEATTKVTVAEFEAYWLAYEQGIADAIGMTWQVTLDGEDRLITVGRK